MVFAAREHRNSPAQESRPNGGIFATGMQSHRAGIRGADEWGLAACTDS